MAHPPWFGDWRATRETCVLSAILAAQAERTPEAACATFEDGSGWTYSDAWEIARRAASGLTKLGVTRGDRVLLFMPNGRGFLQAWFGAALTGATIVPMNTALRGEMLRHTVATADARIMVCHSELADRLSGLDAPKLRDVVFAGPIPRVSIPFNAWSEAHLDGAPLDCSDHPDPSEIAAILFTSGTTGPSKGVMCPHAQLGAAGAASHGYLTPSDRLYVYTPLFHTLGLGAALSALARGASIHLSGSFSAPSFWDDVRAAGCNRIVGLLSSVTGYLAATVSASGPAPFDFSMMSPITRETAQFAATQGFSYFAAFSMTELSVPLITEVDSAVYGSCGRPRDGVECRVVDPLDYETPDGEVGELVVRAREPWTLNAGYFNDPVATAAAWRNGWFHTGDAFRRDADGNFFFVDRLKDAIRRRGENVSSYEVEREISAFPGVMEVAVIGVPSVHGDQEVMAVIAPEPDADLDPVALVAFLAERCAHFTVPRYVRKVSSLPKTSTNKVTKAHLRAEGVTADTWDREAHGIRFRRKALSL